MGARNKLNAACLNSALVIAIMVTAGSGDVLAGSVVGAVVVAIGFISGDIRPTRRY